MRAQVAGAVYLVALEEVRGNGSAKGGRCSVFLGFLGQVLEKCQLVLEVRQASQCWGGVNFLIDLCLSGQQHI